MSDLDMFMQRLRVLAADSDEIKAAVVLFDQWHDEIEILRDQVKATEELSASWSRDNASLRAQLDETVRERETYNGYHQAAVMELDRVKAQLASARKALEEIAGWRNDTLGERPRGGDYWAAETVLNAFDRGTRMAFYRCADRATAALTDELREDRK